MIQSLNNIKIDYTIHKEIAKSYLLFFQNHDVLGELFLGVHIVLHIQ